MTAIMKLWNYTSVKMKRKKAAVRATRNSRMRHRDISGWNAAANLWENAAFNGLLFSMSIWRSIMSKEAKASEKRRRREISAELASMKEEAYCLREEMRESIHLSNKPISLYVYSQPVIYNRSYRIWNQWKYIEAIENESLAKSMTKRNDKWKAYRRKLWKAWREEKIWTIWNEESV